MQSGGETEMKTRDYEIAKNFKEKLSEITQLIDFKIFGSRAKESADEYSDMDVFLEVPELTAELKEKILEISWEVGFENFLVISPLIFTKDEVENSPLKASPILRNIVEEGINI